MKPLWWEHREHRWCLRGWLVRRRVLRIRKAMRAEMPGRSPRVEP